MLQSRLVCLMAVGLLSWAHLGAGEGPAKDDGDEAAFRQKLAEGAAFLSQATKSARARALGCFKAALKLRPESGETYYWIGLTYADLDNYDFAARHAEKATLCDRNLAKAWLLWGQSLMALSQWEEAKAKLDRANELAPDDPLASFNLARCYFHGFQNMNDALYLFKETARRIGDPLRAGRLRETYIQSKLYVGCCCLRKDMTLAAISAFKDVLSIEPDHVDARYRLAVAYRQNDRVAEAESALADLVRLAPQHWEALLQLGHLYVVDRPNRRLAEHYLKLFLACAPADHPWRARVEAHLATAAAEAKGGAAAATSTPTRELPPRPQ